MKPKNALGLLFYGVITVCILCRVDVQNVLMAWGAEISLKRGRGKFLLWWEIETVCSKALNLFSM